MKTSVNLLIIVLALISLTVQPVFSDSCEDSIRALHHSFERVPDEMTLEYVNNAVETCAENQALYKEAARYYKNWYEKEMNPEKQLVYRQQAVEFYGKALQAAEMEKKELKGEMMALQNSRAFSRVAFRALKPSAAGAVYTGLDMHINFKKNSYQLTVDRSLIDELGRIMQEDDTISVSLEGHTDKTGTLEYNNTLSVNRADTVKSYIVENYNVAPERIHVTGYGYRYLLDETDPYGPMNRRVEVIKLSD